MKSKIDYLLAATCAVMIPFVAGGRVRVFGKGVEYDTEILPFLKGILAKSTSVDVSLPIILVFIGGYFIIASFLGKRLAMKYQQQWWYKIHSLLNYLLVFAPMLLLEGTRPIAAIDQRYSQRFFSALDDLFGQRYYILFRLDEQEGYIFYYTLILNIGLLIMVIYYAYNDHPTDSKKEMILDDLG